LGGARILVASPDHSAGVVHGSFDILICLVRCLV